MPTHIRAALTRHRCRFRCATARWRLAPGRDSISSNTATRRTNAKCCCISSAKNPITPARMPRAKDPLERVAFRAVRHNGRSLRRRRRSAPSLPQSASDCRGSARREIPPRIDRRRPSCRSPGHRERVDHMHLVFSRDDAALCRTRERGDAWPGLHRLQHVVEVFDFEQRLGLVFIGEQDVEVASSSSRNSSR